jgi:hypothetical protein
MQFFYNTPIRNGVINTNTMKKLLMLLVALSTFQMAYAIEGNEQKAASKVTKATVFLNGAQVTRTASVNIPKGRSQVKFTGITSKLNKSSVKVSSDGDFTIVSVMHQLNYLEAKKSNTKIDVLDTQADVINDKMQVANEMLAVYREEESLLATNKNLKGSQANLSVAEIRAAADFYRERYTEIKLKKLDLAKEIKSYRKELVVIANQLRELNAQQQKATSEVIVEVNTSKATKANFDISYLVSSAGWYPNYDIRVKNVTSPISLTYKANVFQLSGEDWSNIKLTLSSGNPYQRSVRPILQPWKLNFQYNQPTAYKYQSQQRQSAAPSSGAGYTGTVRGYITDASTGEALIGATVRVVGASIGASTDIDGFYQINIPAGVNASNLQVSYIGYNSNEMPINNSVVNVQLSEGATLDEVVVVGYGKQQKKLSQMFKKDRKRKQEQKAKAKSRRVATNPVQIQKTEKSTTVEFAIELPYSIPTNGKQYAVDIKEESVASDYEYYAAPKLDLSAYLTARIPNWDEYDLLNGEVNLYFEGTYLGKSVLDVNNTKDTMEISLGRDKDIIIERKAQKEYNRRQFIGTKQVATRAWNIKVRNKKKEKIKLVIQDQIPVSSTSEIEVTLKSSKGKKPDLTPSTGILTWELDLKPSAKETLYFKYEVKYPKKNTLSLE